MERAIIKVSDVMAIPTRIQPIPAGISGATVRFEYAGGLWDGLKKTVIFQSYICSHTKPSAAVVVLEPEEVQRIPAEVTARAGHYVSVGVYGTDAEDNLIIPTLWAELGKVREAADPNGDESTDPELPVWAQLQEQIDDLRENGTAGGESIVVDEEGYLTTTSGGFTVDEEGYILL